MSATLVYEKSPTQLHAKSDDSLVVVNRGHDSVLYSSISAANHDNNSVLFNINGASTSSALSRYCEIQLPFECKVDHVNAAAATAIKAGSVAISNVLAMTSAATITINSQSLTISCADILRARGSFYAKHIAAEHKCSLDYVDDFKYDSLPKEDSPFAADSSMSRCQSLQFTYAGSGGVVADYTSVTIKGVFKVSLGDILDLFSVDESLDMASLYPVSSMSIQLNFDHSKVKEVLCITTTVTTAPTGATMTFGTPTMDVCYESVDKTILNGQLQPFKQQYDFTNVVVMRQPQYNANRAVSNTVNLDVVPRKILVHCPVARSAAFQTPYHCHVPESMQVQIGGFVHRFTKSQIYSSFVKGAGIPITYNQWLRCGSVLAISVEDHLSLPLFIGQATNIQLQITVEYATVKQCDFVILVERDANLVIDNAGTRIEYSLQMDSRQELDSLLEQDQEARGSVLGGRRLRSHLYAGSFWSSLKSGLGKAARWVGNNVLPAAALVTKYANPVANIASNVASALGSGSVKLAGATQLGGFRLKPAKV